VELTKQHLGMTLRRTPRPTNLEIMTTKNADFKEWMTMELIDFVQSQASAVSVTDLNRLIADLPALRERFTTIPLQTYPYLSDHLEFLSLVVNDEVTGPNCDPIPQTVSEAAFALLYFQTATDLIPDPIPGMGLLDDLGALAVYLCKAIETGHDVGFAESGFRPAVIGSWQLPGGDALGRVGRAVDSNIRLKQMFHLTVSNICLKLAYGHQRATPAHRSAGAERRKHPQ
jgi:uncharacterized membrane protein YkvA (DUF1232 family)